MPTSVFAVPFGSRPQEEHDPTNATHQVADMQDQEESPKALVNGIVTKVCDSLLDWAIMDVALEAHGRAYRETAGFGPTDDGRGAASSAAELSAEKGTAQPAIALPTSVYEADKNVNVECSNCSTSTSASRYAQHLEKCLGRGGRTSSRTASARLKASAEKAVRESSASHDQEHHGKRRRVASSASSAASPTRVDSRPGSPRLRNQHESASDANESHAPVSHKRRKASPQLERASLANAPPSSTAPSLRKGQGLPPSGRPRP